jgi:hypothetical protein
MIVYANEFYLQPKVDDLVTLKEAIKRWLGKKIGHSFHSTKIIPFAEPFLAYKKDTGTNEVMIIGTPDQANDYSLSINYRHNDVSTQGRAWHTRIGVERKGAESPLHVTILLETSEVSPQAAAIPVEPTQPGIVHEILKLCGLDSKTPGAVLETLTPSTVEQFKSKICNPSRHHALIVVSPDDFSEVPCVDVQKIRDRLVGLAEIFLIPNKQDAKQLRNGVLPSYHTAWDGSVTVISPWRSGMALGKVYRNGEIEALHDDTGLRFDQYLFNDLTHRFNLSKSRRHIGDHVVGRRLVAFKLAELRKKLGNADGLQEIVESYEEDRNKAQKHAQELEEKLLELEIQNDRQREKIGALEDRIRRLQYDLRQTEALEKNSGDGLSQESCLPDSLECVPEWIEAEFPGRLDFTNRAVKTLEDSPYLDVEKVAKVFRILATDFYAAFHKQIKFGDAIASLESIPAEYAGNQSEITSGKKQGYDCTHEGTRYKLEKHIKIGNARDPQYCFRIYFERKSSSQQIVILHAGKHLDTQAT